MQQNTTASPARESLQAQKSRNKQPTPEELFRLYGVKVRDFAKEQSQCSTASTIPLRGRGKFGLTWLARFGDQEKTLRADPAEPLEIGGTWMRNGVEVSLEEFNKNFFNSRI